MALQPDYSLVKVKSINYKVDPQKISKMQRSKTDEGWEER